MLKGEHIHLRMVQPSDAALLFKWENDEQNWRVSDNDSLYTISDITQLIDSLQNIESAKQARYIIVESKTKRSIGAVDLFDIDFEQETSSVGILIAETKDRNLGYASESLKLLEDLCSLELGIQKLKALVHKTNPSSIKLFEKSGYSKKATRQDGQLKNADYIECILFEKWLEK